MFKLRRIALSTGIAITLSTGGCALSNDTVTSLVDLVATSSGSFVEIAIRGVLTAILADNPNPDLTVPLSEQSH